MQGKYILRLWAFINPLSKSRKVCRLQWITTFLFQSLCLYRIESGVLAFLARHATRVLRNSHITREIMVILPHLSHHTLTLCFTFQFFSRVNYLGNLMEVIWFWPQYIFRNILIVYISWNPSLFQYCQESRYCVDEKKLFMDFEQGSSERPLEVWMMGLGDVLFTYSIKEGGGPEWQNEYIENSQLCRKVLS